MSTSLTGLTGGLGTARGIPVVGSVCSVGGTCLALNLVERGCSVKVYEQGCVEVKLGVWIGRDRWSVLTLTRVVRKEGVRINKIEKNRMCVSIKCYHDKQ